MEWMRAHESQSLRIDVNSNGITKELLDLCALRTTHPGRYFQSATVVGLGQQIAVVTLGVGLKSHSLEAKVVGSQIEQVTAEII